MAAPRVVPGDSDPDLQLHQREPPRAPAQNLMPVAPPGAQPLPYGSQPVRKCALSSQFVQVFTRRSIF